MHADYQYGGSGGNQTSWHYTVDADEVWQSFADDRACWHAGHRTGNYRSIALEICVNDKTRFAEACDNAAVLTADLLIKHGLTPEKVVQHNFWSGKNCPAELRSGAWGVTWEKFIMKVKDFFARAATLAAFESLAVEPPVPDWQAAALDKLVADGVINTPEYWRPRLGQPVTAGEMFNEFCLVHAKFRGSGETVKGD
jgi:hypothetical protein